MMNCTLTTAARRRKCVGAIDAMLGKSRDNRRHSKHNQVTGHRTIEYDALGRKIVERTSRPYYPKDCQAISEQTRVIRLATRKIPAV